MAKPISWCLLQNVLFLAIYNELVNNNLSKLKHVNKIKIQNNHQTTNFHNQKVLFSFQQKKTFLPWNMLADLWPKSKVETFHSFTSSFWCMRLSIQFVTCLRDTNLFSPNFNKNKFSSRQVFNRKLCDGMNAKTRRLPDRKFDVNFVYLLKGLRWEKIE